MGSTARCQRCHRRTRQYPVAAHQVAIAVDVHQDTGELVTTVYGSLVLVQLPDGRKGVAMAEGPPSRERSRLVSHYDTCRHAASGRPPLRSLVELPRCVRCRWPMRVYQPGQTTHPTCDPPDRRTN